MTSPSTITLLLLALSMPADPPVPLCLSVAEQTVSVELTDAPDIRGGTVRFSRWDRARLETELRLRGLDAEAIRAALRGFVLVEPREGTMQCGTCQIGFWYPAKASCGNYYGTQWCIRCRACPPGPEPIS